MKRIIKIFFKLFLYFNVFSILWVFLYSLIPIPFTYTMLQSALDKNEKYNYTWKAYEEIDSDIPLAFVASEDQKFPTHSGFDFEGIKLAYQSNQKGDKIRGGSTISQQVAKNAFLWQKKSYLRKSLEAYYTVLIEIIWSKKRILEVYMNICETGINTFGVEEGSQRYFKKSSASVNKYEAAQLAQVLPSPKKYNATINKRTQHIVKQMNNLGSNYLQSID